MVLPIGGFMPIPLAMMIPFMATQSMVMGDAFGRAFQYGKRKISAMSNEEFNATSLEQQASEMFKAYKIIIGENHLQNAILESTKLQKIIIQEMLLILPKFISQTGDDLFATDIKTKIPGQRTITGRTENRGIVTTHYSDGTSTVTSTPETQQKSVSLIETLPISANRANIPPNAEITAETRTKLIAHYKTQIKQLQEQFNKLSLTSSSSNNSTMIRKAQTAMRAIRTAKVQQNRFLTNVRNWQRPF